ncbi:hypothetical protein [Streptomyces erythrochromogenes]|uniref:hypothetical protein n=1 Tax=Streptomyces erythrochromogenes TaxID=285574 RepID=UPI00342353BB
MHAETEVSGQRSAENHVHNVAVNAWMASHIHGEDGCTGCQDKRPTGTDLQARMDTITAMTPDITKWFNREVWTAALNDTGCGVTRG